MARGDVKTPKGTKPGETRVATKHKRPSYGLELIAKHAARKARRAARAAKPVPVT